MLDNDHKTFSKNVILNNLQLESTIIEFLSLLNKNFISEEMFISGKFRKDSYNHDLF